MSIPKHALSVIFVYTVVSHQIQHTSSNDELISKEDCDDAEMVDTLNMDAEEFESIMSNAESKKRLAELTFIDDTSKQKTAPIPLSTIMRSGRGR